MSALARTASLKSVIDFWTRIANRLDLKATPARGHGPMMTPRQGGVLVGYGRTSTTEQAAGLEAQLRDLKAAGCRKIFQEQVSSVAERAQLDAALDYIRENDTLVVTTLDRFARSARHLIELIEKLEAKGVSFRILNLCGGTVDTRGATCRLVLNAFAAFA